DRDSGAFGERGGDLFPISGIAVAASDEQRVDLGDVPRVTTAAGGQQWPCRRAGGERHRSGEELAPVQCTGHDAYLLVEVFPLPVRMPCPTPARRNSARARTRWYSGSNALPFRESCRDARVG